MIINKDEQKFSLWWNKTITDGELADIRYKIKGFFVWMPYGFSLMKNIKTYWDSLFEEENIKEMYFPLLVPTEYAENNSSWWNSFKEQALYSMGYFENDKKTFLRPTGEPAMYPMFSLWIRSHRDLPLRIYETVNSYRNETKSTKAFVRDVEIGPWYEIHTCSATKEESEKEIELAIKMNDMIFDMLAVARIKVRKPQSDCFPGSVGAVEFYTMLNDKLVENGSCNNLGQAYAKAFNITYTDEKEEKKYVWQTCTGNGERFIAAVIGNHADEKGLVLPPEVAPKKVAIVLFKVKEKEVKIKTGLSKKEFYIIETSSLGEERFKAEKTGIPLRIEIGPKELKEKSVLLCYRTGQKKKVKIVAIEKEIKTALDEIQKELRKKSEEELKGRIKEAKTIEEAKKTAIAIVGWCGKEECSDLIKHNTKKDIIGMTLEKKKMKCINCKEEGEATYISESY